MGAEEVYSRMRPIRDDLYTPQYDPGVTQDLMASTARSQAEQQRWLNNQNVENAKERSAIPGQVYDAYNKGKARSWAEENARQQQALNEPKISAAEREERGAQQEEEFRNAPLSEEEVTKGQYKPGQAPASRREALGRAETVSGIRAPIMSEEAAARAQQELELHKQEVRMQKTQVYHAIDQSNRGNAIEDKGLAKAAAEQEYGNAYIAYGNDPARLAQENERIASKYSATSGLTKDEVAAAGGIKQAQLKAGAAQEAQARELVTQSSKPYQDMKEATGKIHAASQHVTALATLANTYAAHQELGGMHDAPLAEDAREKFSAELEASGDHAAAEEVRGMGLSISGHKTVSKRMEDIVKAKQASLDQLGQHELATLNPDMLKRPEVATAQNELGQAKAVKLDLTKGAGGAKTGQNAAYLTGAQTAPGGGQGGNYHLAQTLNPPQQQQAQPIQNAPAQQPQQAAPQGVGAPGAAPINVPAKTGSPGGPMIIPQGYGANPAAAQGGGVSPVIGGGAPDPLGLMGKKINSQGQAVGVQQQ